MKVDFLESRKPADFAPNIEALLDRGCDIILGGGVGLADTLRTAAEAHPSRSFVAVGFEYRTPPDNVLSLTFDMAQPAFLAGYLAAGMTETGKVGAFGGLNTSSVTRPLNAFWSGVQRYNRHRKRGVRVVGWDPANPDAGLLPGRESRVLGRRLAQRLIRRGAGIIMPVAAQGGLGAADAARAAGDVGIVWVGSDGCRAVAAFCDLIVTSVVANVDQAVVAAIRDLISGGRGAGLYVGTLQNGGVGLSQAMEGVPGKLRADVAALRRAVIEGRVHVTVPHG